MEPKKKMKIDATSDAVSWMSHPIRIFGQPKKRKENENRVIANDDLTKSPQTSTGQHNNEDVLTNNGLHVFKDETCSNMEKTLHHVTPESNGSRNEDNMDQNESVKEPMTMEVEAHEEKKKKKKKKKKNVQEIKTKNDETIRCLSLIQNVAIKLKNEDDVFYNTIMKILDLDKMQDSTVKALKYDLVNILLVLLLDSTEDDLKLIENKLKAMIIPDPIKRFVVDDSCIRQCDNFLGEGFSSVVQTGFFSKDGSCTRVALKKPKPAPRADFFSKMIIGEATILSQLDHKNIIRMLAYQKNGPVIALELMEMGNLIQALRRVRFTDRELLRALIDIATGMEFLHGKHYLHRDLACQNVFVNARRECKIGDFGLSVYVGDSNGIYQEKEEEGVCSNTISPETVVSRIFRFQTDVWSMGKLIFDMYQLVSFNIMDQFFLSIMTGHLIVDGNQRRKPERCPNDLFQFTVNHLLNLNFENRPNFSVIRATIENFLAK